MEERRTPSTARIGLLEVDSAGEKSVRQSIVWARLLGVTGAVLRGVEWAEDAGAVVAQVRPRARDRNRCGICGRRCGRYDLGEGRYAVLRELDRREIYLKVGGRRILSQAMVASSYR